MQVLFILFTNLILAYFVTAQGGLKLYAEHFDRRVKIILAKINNQIKKAIFVLLQK
jgi:hypothetical protein